MGCPAVDVATTGCSASIEGNPNSTEDDTETMIATNAANRNYMVSETMAQKPPLSNYLILYM